MEKVSKSVKIGAAVYTVEAGEDGVTARETHFPVKGYGNNYGTEYAIFLTKSKRWAKIKIKVNFWTEHDDFTEIATAEQLIAKIRESLNEAEDGTPDVKQVFDEIIKVAGAEDC